MTKVFASFFLILSIAGSFAQNETEEINTDQYLTNKSITFKPEEVHYAGSAYENDKFVSGYVFKNGRMLASNIGLRYNAFRDEIEVKTNIDAPNTSAKVMMRNPDIYVKLLNKLIVFSPAKEGISRPGYFIVLAEGEKADLYKKLSKEYIEGSESMTSLTRDIPSTYKEKETYYFVDKKTGAFEELPTGKNAKFALFKDLKKQMKAYADKERININKEWGLKKIVNHYNQL